MMFKRIAAFFFLLAFVAASAGADPIATVEVENFLPPFENDGRLAANVSATINGKAVIEKTLESSNGEVKFLVKFTPNGGTEQVYEFAATTTGLTENNLPTFIGVITAVGQGGEEGDEPIPNTPTDLSATVTDVVQLNWAFQEADHFNIYRSETPGGPYVFVGESAIVLWGDETVISDTQYYYVVRAANSLDEESADSNEVGAFPSLPLKHSPAFYLNTIKPGTFIVDGANLIAQASDSSGNNRHVVQATDANKPTLTGGNTLSFGGNDWLEVSASYTVADIFFILTPTTSNSRDILGKFASATGRINKHSLANHISRSNITGNVDFQINGIDSYLVNRGIFSFNNEVIVVRATLQTPLSADALALGRGINLTSSLFDGTLRDVIIYSSALTDEDAAEVNTYLISKAAIASKSNVINVATVLTTSNPASTFSDFVAPAITNGALYVLVSSSITHSPTGVTWQGNSLTLVDDYTETDGSNVSIWRYLLGATSAEQSGDIVVTFNNSGRHHIGALLVNYVNQSTSEADLDGLTALATTPMSLTLDSAATALALDVVHWTGGTSSSGSIGADQVLIFNSGGQVSLVNRQERASYKRSAAGSTTMSQTRTTPTEGSYMGLTVASP